MKAKAFRTVLIVLIVLTVLGTGLAVAAQYYGAPWGLVLGPVGRIYTDRLISGRYVAGEDLPAGTYTLTFIQGKGVCTAPVDGLPVDMTVDGADRGTYSVELAQGEALTLVGLEATVRCGNTKSAAVPREGDPSLDRAFTLTADGGEGGRYIAGHGRGFPAGVYTARALAGSGTVTVDGGLALAMDGDGPEGAETSTDGRMRTFRHLKLTDGAVVQLEGVELRLIPE